MDPEMKRETSKKTSAPLSDAVIAELAKAAQTTELFGPDGVLEQVKQRLMQAMLEGEMTAHLGYEAHERQAGGRDNHRNGSYERSVQTDTGTVTVQMPRDRNGTFVAKLLPKHRRRLHGFDDKVLALYARGVSQRDIQSALSEFYGAEVSQELISEVTDEILPEAQQWQQRPLDAVYPVVYLDALFVFVKHEGVVAKRPVYLALGINAEGRREVLGLWMGAERGEGARFWLSVLTDLKSRGVVDILYACCDGLTGFPEAITTAFPQTVVQTCIVHLLRASLRYVREVDRRAVTAALKSVYSAVNAEAAVQAFAGFEAAWGARYPAIVRQWQTRWHEMVPFLAYPVEIRKILYTTNAIESINSQLRRVLRPKGHFPSDDSVLKIAYLALRKAQGKWNPSIHWKQAAGHFAIVFEGRFPA